MFLITALPPIPPVTIEQKARFDYITDIDFLRNKMLNQGVYEEYLGLVFLIQTHTFIRLATDEYVNFADENYLNMAWKNYEAYLNNK